MRLPPENAAFLHRVRFGVYVARSLEVAKLTEMSRAVFTITLALLAAGRAWEDADIAAFGASASRNAARSELAEVAGNTRAELSGRGRAATRKQPYKLIFPDRIGWYISAPLAELVDRYSLLINRLRTQLPEGDRALDSIALLEAGLAAFRAGEGILSNAHLTLDEKRQALRVQQEAFDAAMIALRGSLLQHYADEAKAEAHFPRAT